MAWSWSHTQEAYENAQANTHGLSLKKLREIWAEWQSAATEEIEFLESLLPKKDKI